jgi:energy-coupling factor transporter ATP-binding protein EcfA2
MVKLRWLEINQFRSVKPGTRLDFAPGYNVLLGQNGTGKTTLLNLVAAVAKGDFTDYKDIEFDLRFELASTSAKATVSARNVPRMSAHEPMRYALLPVDGRSDVLKVRGEFERPEFSAEVELVSAANEPSFHLEIQGPQLTLKRMDAPASEAPIMLIMPGGTHRVGPMVQNGLSQWIWDRGDVLSGLTELFSQQEISRFDESLGYLASLSQFKIRLTRTAEKPMVSMELNRDVGFLNELVAKAAQRWGQERYSFTAKEIPFLEAAIRLLDFESAEVSVELQESETRGGFESMTLGDLRFLFTHRGGWRLTEKHLSYGQKRLLAFMQYLATVRSVAVADELVNGLHHRWIQDCIKALGDRQAFLTSQNPLLLDYLTFESPEQVRSTFILCRWEGEGKPAQMRWDNMPQEAAEDFFDSYKVGFQQVGELLQSKGLW